MRGHFHFQKGAILALTALLLPVLFGFLGLL